MLRVIRKEDLLYLTEQERTEYDLECTSLVYTFPDLIMTEEVRGRIRPFKALWEKKRDLYKLALLNYLPDILSYGHLPIPTSREESDRVCKEVGEIAFMMGYDASKIPAEYEIRYECDTWNGLEDIYGERLVRLFKNYLILSSSEQELVKKVWTTSKERQLGEARKGNWEDLIELFPSHIQSELLIFGKSDSAGEEGSVLEFKRKTPLGPELPNLKETIHAEFKLGEFLMEGAQDVKDRLAEVYERCGVERNPKAKDLEEWFVVMPCRVKGKRGFRIDFRR